ncbi:hypothetical protein [Streptomyces sp. NPDC047706]|uniref:hypothetical protein n=1 Tax=Streptomyces sp. NPDC047706 TaxID=3365486 RepID=UPI003717083A
MPFETYVADFSGKAPTGDSYFREVSTRKRPTANLAFDLAPSAGSGLYLSAIHMMRTSRTTLLDPTAVPGRIRFTA